MVKREEIYKLPTLTAVYSFDDNALEQIKNSRSVLDNNYNKANTIEYINSKILTSTLTEMFAIQHEVISFDNNNHKDIPKYNIVVLGGTFDLIHNGHRKLLTLAAAVCQSKLIVGITGDKMLVNKSKAYLISDIHIRSKGVKDVLNCLFPSLNVEIVPIDDPFGPTITDPNIDAIVVSSETIIGAFKINKIRNERNMRSLSVLVSNRDDAASLSSSFLRDKKNSI